MIRIVVEVPTRQSQHAPLIFYDKIKDKPQLTFLTPRHDATKLPLDQGRLKERKSLAEEKLQHVLNYAKQTTECRMKFICGYFGEDLEEDCGICDVCLSRKNRVNKPNYKKIYTKVIEELSIEAKSEKEIIALINDEKREDVLVAIKTLLDEGRIYLDQGGKLHCIK